MNYHLVIQPEAENDLKEIFTWYEEKRKGLGHDFFLQIEAGLKFIERNPEAFPIEYKVTRKFLIKRFPYKIIYLIDKQKVIVLAALHCKRNPELLKEKVKSIL